MSNYTRLIALLPLLLNCQLAFAQLPLKPSRELSFTTQEGSFMNVDLSPDGKTLVFDLLGDLYTLPVKGGTATQLTNGISLNLRPAWSPDGTKIACISDRTGHFQLSVLDLKTKAQTSLGTKNETLYYGQRYLWAPNGRFIFLNEKAISLKRGTMTSLLPGIPVRFDPVGEGIYYRREGRLFYRGNPEEPERSLTPALGSEPLAVSPNGRWICYYEESNHLMVYDTAQKQSKVLIAADKLVNPAYLSGMPLPQFGITADSRFVFISYQGQIHQIDLASGNDQIIPFKANVKVKLGKLAYHQHRVTSTSVPVKYVRAPSERADGQQLAFTALNKIYLKNLPSGAPQILYPQSLGQFQPTYSPDGKMLAYVSWKDSVGGAVWVYTFGNNKAECLTQSTEQFHQPVWSPDGTAIAFFAGPALSGRDDRGKGELRIMRIKDHLTTTLDTNINLKNKLSFSADGRHLFYAPQRVLESNASPMLTALRLADHQKTIIAAGRDNYTMQLCEGRSLSPDGQFIVYSLAEDLYLVPVNTAWPNLIYAPNENISAIRFARGIDPAWTKNGDLIWVYGNQVYKSSPADILATKIQSNQSAKTKTADTYGSTVNIIPKIKTSIQLNLSFQQATNPEVYALINATIITMDKHRIINNGVILVKNGRIKQIGTGKQIKVAQDIVTIDLEGKTIIPGFIDVHLHIGLPPDILRDQFWMLQANLAYGITTVRDPSSSYDAFGYAELINAGYIKGPRLFSVGQAVRTVTAGINLVNAAEANEIAKKRSLLGGISLKQYQTDNRQQQQWLLKACDRYAINMTNESHGNPLEYLSLLKDGNPGIEHNAKWGTLYNDNLQLLTRSGTYTTATLQVNYGTEYAKAYFNWKYWNQPDQKLKRFSYSDPAGEPTSNGPESIEAIMHAKPADTLNPGFLIPSRINARIFHAGGKVALGSHGNNPGTGLHNEIWGLQMGGLSNYEALQIATIEGAKALGIDKDLGSLQTGKIADLIILNANPLDDIHHTRDIKYVVKDGIIYNGDDLQVISITKQ